MVIRSVWLSGTVRLVVTSIPIHMVIVGLGDCRFIIFMLYLFLREFEPYLGCGERDIFTVYSGWDCREGM